MLPLALTCRKITCPLPLACLVAGWPATGGMIARITKDNLIAGRIAKRLFAVPVRSRFHAKQR